MISVDQHELSEIRSEEIQEIISKNPSWIIQYGIIVILFILAVLATLSWFIQYPDTVKTNLTVTSSPPPQNIIARVPGSLILLKKDNDTVKQDELIAYLQAEVDPVYILKLEKTVAAYLNGTENRDYLINSLSAYPNTAGTLSEFISVAIKSITPHEGSNGEINYLQRVNYLEEQLSALKGSNSRLSGQLGPLRQLRDSLDSAKIANAAFQFNFVSLESTMLENERKIEELEWQISNLKIEQANKMEGLSSQFEDALRKLMEQISMWKGTHLFIAPQDGTLVFRGILENNVNIEPGPLFIILPLKRRVIAHAELPAGDVGKMKKGQVVHIRLTMYPSWEFGIVPGVVDAISTVPEDDHYQVLIRLPEGMTTSYKKDLPFRMNLSGEAEIITDNLRLAERFFYNLRAMI